MKKVVFLLLIVFVLGGIHLSAFSVTSYSANHVQKPPSGEGTGSGTKSKNDPQKADSKRSLMESRAGDQPNLPNNDPKKVLQARFNKLKTDADNLQRNGDRAEQVRKLREDLAKLGKDLSAVNAPDAEAIGHFGQQLDLFQLTYNSLKLPPGTAPLQPSGGQDQSANDAKTDLQNKVKNLEESVNSLDKEGPQKADIIKLLGEIHSLKSQIDKADLTAEGQVDTLNTRINGFSDRYQKIAADGASQSFSFLEWIIYGFVGLLVLGGIATGIYFLLKKREEEKIAIRNTFAQLKARDSELSNKVEDFKKVITDLSQQVAQQKSDISRLKQVIANQTAAEISSFSPPQIETLREQPRFPVAVEDYLGRVEVTGPVKFDYKEGMLVSDTENSGGMILVKDEGQTYLIPGFKFFQTKNDYTNYLERYFDCARPMAGTVWIRQPATVTKSGSGWQVVTRGDLEVR